jgi:hypothetical protein
MSKKNQVKNTKAYSGNNGLIRVQSIVPQEAHDLFDEATMKNKTTMSEAIRDFINKYNTKFINHYGK